MISKADSLKVFKSLINWEHASILLDINVLELNAGASEFSGRASGFCISTCPWTSTSIIYLSTAGLYYTN